MSSAKPAAPKTYGIFNTEISEDTVDVFLKKLVGEKKVNILADFESELVPDWNIILVTTSSNEDMIKFSNENTVITRIDMKIFTYKDKISDYVYDNADKGILDFSDITSKFNFYKYPSQLTTILFIAGVYSYNEDIKIFLLNLSYCDIKILKFSFKTLFPNLKSIDLSGNPILGEEKEPWQNEFNIITTTPPPKDFGLKKEDNHVQISLPKKKEKAIISTDKPRMYAIFNKTINVQTNAKFFLSTIINEKICNELEPTIDPNWHLIFVEAKYNLAIYSTKDTAITTFDYKFFLENKSNITNYVSKNTIKASLDLSDLKHRFNYFKFLSQLPTFLYIAGIYSMILGNQIVSIDLSNNEILKFKFSFKIIFPDLQSLNVTGNPGANDIKSEYKDFFEVLTDKKKENPYSIMKPSTPEIQKGKQKMYAIYNRNINNRIDISQFFLNLIKNEQIYRELIDPMIEPNWNLIFVQAEYDIVRFTTSNTAITGFDLPFFQNNNMHLVKYVADTFKQESGSIDLSNMSNKFTFYKHGSQLNTVLFIIGIDSIRKNRKILFIDLSNNNITMLKFSFKIIFPFLQRIEISNNPIEKLKPNQCYASYINPPKTSPSPINTPVTSSLSSEPLTYAIYNRRISEQTKPIQFLFELTNNNRLCEQSQYLLDKKLNLIFVKTKYPLKDYQNEETAIDIFDLNIYNSQLNDMISEYINTNIRMDGSLDLSYLQSKFKGIYKSFIQVPTFLFVFGIISIRNHKKITRIDLSHNSLSQISFHFPVLFPHLTFVDLVGKLPANNFQQANIFNTVPLNCILKSVKTGNLTYTIKLPIGKFIIFDKNFDDTTKVENYLMSIFKDNRICDKLHPEIPPDSPFIYVESQYNLEVFNSKNTAIVSYDANFLTSNNKSITDYAEENITEGFIDLSNLSAKFSFYQNNMQLTTVLLIIGIYSVMENPDITSINLSNNKIINIRFPFKNFFPNLDSINLAANPIVNHANIDKFFGGINIIKSELPPPANPLNTPQNIPPGIPPTNPLNTPQNIPTVIPLETPPEFIPVNEDTNDDEEVEEEEEEEEEEESDDDFFEDEEDDIEKKYLSHSYDIDFKNEDKKSSFKKRFHYEDKELPSHFNFALKSKFQEEPNFCLPEHRVSLSDFEAIRLNVREFPTHEFITSFFYDSWLQIEAIQDYYGPDSVFSLCVQIRNEYDLRNCPSLHYYKKYSRNLLLPNTNIAIGSANIARANSEYLFVNGFKAKPTSFSYFQVGNNFCYVFHGVFESDIITDIDPYIQKNVKEIMRFDRSFNIQLREEGYVITNDNLLIRMYKY